MMTGTKPGCVDMTFNSLSPSRNSVKSVISSWTLSSVSGVSNILENAEVSVSVLGFSLKSFASSSVFPWQPQAVELRRDYN